MFPVACPCWETHWIGGQLTNQAVPPDEHPWIEEFGASARYRALREGIREYYRTHLPMTEIARANRTLNPGNGWVSRLCHDPRIAVAVLRTLQGISKLRIARAEVATQIRQAHRTLSGVVSLRHCSASECVDRLYNRLNNDYRLLHGICRLFLENVGPGIDRGEYETIPFCVDMPKLFEAFIAEWLKANAPVNLLVGAQYVSRLNANAELSFRIDVVLRQRETNRVIGILDTKYKAADTPEESDIQQVVAYALEMGTDKAFLIYPTSKIRPFKAMVGKFGHVIVRSISFDLNARLDQEGPRFFTEVLEKLQQP
jgi:5-methylcytosine-specific restriction enzyme subunit McrC